MSVKQVEDLSRRLASLTTHKMLNNVKSLTCLVETVTATLNCIAELAIRRAPTFSRLS